MQAKTYISMLLSSTLFVSTLSAQIHEVEQTDLYETNRKPVAVKDDWNPNIHRADKEGFSAGVTANYLFLYGTETNLAYAYESFLLGSSTMSGLAEGQLLYPKFSANSGFEVGIHGSDDVDSWNVDLVYTWYYAKPRATSATIGQSDIVMSPVWGELTSPVYFADGSWMLRFQDAMLNISRRIIDQPMFYLAPSIGLHGGYQKQKYDVNYRTFNGSDIILDYLRFNTDFWGIGARIGADSEFFICNNFSLFGNFGGSQLYSRYNTLETHQTNFQGLAIDDVSNYRSKLWTNTYVIDMKLGLRYIKFMESWSANIHVGWDERLWLDHNYFQGERRGGGPQGNLTLQGLTAGFEVNF